MPVPEPTSPAERALQLLFKKLHPLLEDTAHALAKGAETSALIRLHGKLQASRVQATVALEAMAEETDDAALAEVLENLSANLTPLGEPFQQSLILTQLCLEEAPAELLPFVPAGAVGSSSWGPRMTDFLAHLADPAFQARPRWADVDPDLGDDAEDLA